MWAIYAPKVSIPLDGKVPLGDKGGVAPLFRPSLDSL